MAISTMKSVEVGVCYPWESDCDPSLKGDKAWQDLKNLIQATCDTADGMIQKKYSGVPQKSVHVRRVRATAGQLLLDSLRDCINAKDIIVGHLATGDAATANPNVCFELGYAFAQKKRIFLTTEFDANKTNGVVPSDLSGFYVTTLDGEIGPGYDKSLQATLRAAILDEFAKKNNLDHEEFGECCDSKISSTTEIKAQEAKASKAIC
jgi:hypothetical protein